MSNFFDFNGENCALCRKNKDLQQSHIIPKFIANWIKETSATGYLRGVEEPNVKIQDIKKIPLLCKDCEQKFSKLESYFADKIFYPFQEKGVENFSYNKSLFNFIVSINWRVLVTQRKNVNDEDFSNFTSHINQAEEIWRKYLMGSRNDTNDFEHHVFFIDELNLEKTNSEIPPSFSAYTLRAIDSTYVVGEDRVLIYTKFPSIIIVSSVYPCHLEGWNGTEVKKRGGKISSPQKIDDPQFGSFLNERSKLIDFNISEKQEETIIQDIAEDTKRFADSDSFESWLQKKKIKIRKGIKNFPKSVKNLVEMIESCIYNVKPNLSPEEQVYRKTKYIFSAEKLSDISIEQAKQIDKKIKENIKIAKIRNKENLSVIDIDDIVILFQIYFGTTKAEREKRTREKMNEIEAKNKFPETDHVIMFGFDPIETDENPTQIAITNRDFNSE